MSKYPFRVIIAIVFSVQQVLSNKLNLDFSSVYLLLNPIFCLCGSCDIVNQVGYDDFVAAGSLAAAREKGLVS